MNVSVIINYQTFMVKLLFYHCNISSLINRHYIIDTRSIDILFRPTSLTALTVTGR